MKKSLVFAVILALLLPAAAFAATEFTLGGFVKLDSFWDSTQQGKNMNTLIARNNNFVVGSEASHHGRMKFTAQGSRFNFTIKGPNLWGATTTGYIEMDFDPSEEGLSTGAANTGAGRSASNSYTPRLRHAMFRFNWPTTELLMGQYWSFFCENYPELVEDGPMQGTGAPTARLPQIRVTQTFLETMTVALMAGEANAFDREQSYSGNDRGGAESGEAPQIQGKLAYAQDLWGKAAYYGVPKPFTAQVAAGWQRGYTQEFNALGLQTFGGQNLFGENFYNPVTGATQHQALNPWLVMGSVFVPVIPTHSANLAGTASILTQWWYGQGVGAFGFSGDQSLFKFAGINQFGQNRYDAQLQTRFGGFIQGQYYFTNQWFVTGAYGISRTVGVSNQGPDGNGNASYATLAGSDLLRTWQQAEFNIWYRPITAIKFGLQYAYGYNQYFQNLSSPGINNSQVGTAHRLEFVGFFYF